MTHLYYIWFHQFPTFQRCPKTKKTLCACAEFFLKERSQEGMPLKLKIFFRGYFGWVKIWKMMRIHKKFCALKFPKIREKVFNNRWFRGWTKWKTGRSLHHSSFLLSSVMEFYYHPFRSFFCSTLMYIHM